MKYLSIACIFGLGYLAANLSTSSTAADPPATPTPTAKVAAALDKLANPSIDMPGYLKVAAEAEKHRRTHRVTEDEFIKMSEEKGTIILDARSKEMFDLLHVKGAMNLTFADIDVVSLAKMLPDKNARILIYCNNNFTPAPGEKFTAVTPNAAAPLQQAKVAAVAKEAFRPKEKIASLNISTYTALYSYGYKNVYELAPLLDPAKTKIAFESTSKTN